MELDRVPLWRGDHVAIKQLAEDFARYPYLPRLRDTDVLLHAVHDGLGLLLWTQDSFAYADSFDEAAGRYRGLRCGQLVNVMMGDLTGLLLRPERAQKQLEAEAAAAAATPGGPSTPGGVATVMPGGGAVVTVVTPPPVAARPKRFHGAVTLDSARVGRDASRIADEVISHLTGLVGAKVTVTLEIEADVPGGAPENVVRTVTENSRTLKFTSHGFEAE